jgi:hypothetical protein
MGVLVDPKASLDYVEKRNILSLRGIKPLPSIAQLIPKLTDLCRLCFEFGGIS